MKFILDTAGHSQGKLECSSFDSSCGHVDHGLGFNFTNQARWVVSFEDFERLYLRAKAVRNNARLRRKNEYLSKA
jgi:hypothetical protein